MTQSRRQRLRENRRRTMQTIQKLTHWEITIDSLSYREQVQVPHTWNVHEKTEHYRGKAHYRTTLPIAKEAAATRLHLCFGAVYHTAEVFVNGVRVGIHSCSGYNMVSHTQCFADFTKRNGGVFKWRNLILCLMKRL